MRDHQTFKGPQAVNMSSYIYQWLHELAVECMTPDMDEAAAAERVDNLLKTIEELGKDGQHQSWFRVNVGDDSQFEAHLVLTLKKKENQDLHP